MKDFHGQEIHELKYKDGSTATSGDVIQWHCDDTDDMTTWTFMGIYKSNKIIYMGGGIDFGMGVGQEMLVSEVIAQAEDNDSHYQGIERIGIVSELVRHIKKLNQGI